MNSWAFFLLASTMSNPPKIIRDSWSHCVPEIMGSIGIQFGNLENYLASIADQDSKNSNKLFVKKNSQPRGGKPLTIFSFIGYLPLCLIRLFCSWRCLYYCLETIISLLTIFSGSSILTLNSRGPSTDLSVTLSVTFNHWKLYSTHFLSFNQWLMHAMDPPSFPNLFELFIKDI